MGEGECGCSAADSGLAVVAGLYIMVVEEIISAGTLL